ncbi:exported hypothetical protein [Verrucomicrobia bacterium]|nr:exported hypothetical protein [Verrucomicrobiota bacterium]
MLRQPTSRSAWSACSLLSLLPLSKAKDARNPSQPTSHSDCFLHRGAML